MASFSFKRNKNENNYAAQYNSTYNEFFETQLKLIRSIEDNKGTLNKEEIKKNIGITRRSLKAVDFWFRYFEPIAYKKINGPLPVEWETEVFEKFEKPYRREGAGLTLAELYLDEQEIDKDSLLTLLRASLEATSTFAVDSITDNLKNYHHFFLCNRLFLLNLATIYTSGFECPDAEKVIPELRAMLSGVHRIYMSYNESFSETPLPKEYLDLYSNAIIFVNEQAGKYDQFDHFTFLKDFINPMFGLNQRLIREYAVQSSNTMDYSLNKSTNTIFSKTLYNAQNIKGVFNRVYDPSVLTEIEALGRLLFYDPILSGNNLRSCASCHKPSEFFADTVNVASLQFDRQRLLSRNTPSLLNAQYNHLLMLDGGHISLHDQARGVITNSLEMACSEQEMLNKIKSCKDYRQAFEKLVKYTPQEPELSTSHVTSALILYYIIAALVKGIRILTGP
jgi:cytochrome c peroxidase